MGDALKDIQRQSWERRVAEIESERDALRKFKEWVHAYLDAKGIPTHPDGPHSKDGCRIGDRMDLVFAELDQLKADNHRLRLGDMSSFDYERLVAWINDPHRKPTELAFTAGAARTAAQAVKDSGIFERTEHGERL